MTVNLTNVLVVLVCLAVLKLIRVQIGNYVDRCVSRAVRAVKAGETLSGGFGSVIGLVFAEREGLVEWRPADGGAREYWVTRSGERRLLVEARLAERDPKRWA